MLEFLLGENLSMSLLTQLTGAPCENGRAVGLGKHENERPPGEAKEKVNAQNPKAGFHTLSVWVDY